MKLCKLCGSTYDDRVDFCFRDGTPLSKAAVEVAAPAATDAGVEAPTETEEMDAPMPVAMLRGGGGTTQPFPASAQVALPKEPLPPPEPLSPAESLAAEEVAVMQTEEAGPAELPAPLAAPIALARRDHQEEEGTLSGLGDLPGVEHPPMAAGSPFEEEDLAPPEEIQPIAPLPSPAMVDAEVETQKSPALPRPVPLVAPVVKPALAAADLDFPEPAASTEDEPAPPPKRSMLLPLLGVFGLIVVVGGGLFVALRPGPPKEIAVAAPQPPAAPVATEAPTPAAAPAEAPPAEAPPAEAPPAEAPAAEAPAAEAPPATAPVAAAPPETAAPHTAPAVPAAPHAVAATAPAAAATAPEAKPTTLNVISTPAGARVLVDDKAVGQTPLNTEIKSGVHVVRLEMDGFQSTSRTVKASGEPVAVSLNLDALPMTGQVNIFGPTGATVWLDEKKVGTLPVTAQVQEGRHTFKVVTAEGTTFSQTQEVHFSGPGQPMIVSLSGP